MGTSRIMKVMVAIIVALALATALPEIKYDQEGFIQESVPDVNTEEYVSDPTEEEFAESEESSNSEQEETNPVADAQAAVTAAENCNKDTGGTCNVMSCYSWRGATKCEGPVFGKKCLCKSGLCRAWDSSNNGYKCVDTLTPAKEALAKVQCQQEKEAAKQEKTTVEQEVSTATAAVASATKTKETATQTEASAKEAVTSATAAVQDAKNEKQKAETCNKDTGGTCNVMSCYSWRGATKCEGPVFGKKCLCKSGQCPVYDSSHKGNKCVDLLNPAEAKLATAESQLGDANTDLGTKQSDLTAAGNALTTAEKALTVAKDKLKAATTKLTTFNC